MIDKALAWNTCLSAQACKHGCRGSVGSILLCCIKLDDRSAAKHRMVGGVVLLGIIWVPCVCVIGRNHEGTLHSLIVGLLGVALRQGNALEHIREEWAACSLLSLRACLLVVEDGKHFGGIGVVGSKHGLESGKTHREVVETSGRDKLVVRAEGAGRCGVCKIEVEVENVLLLDRALLI